MQQVRSGNVLNIYFLMLVVTVSSTLTSKKKYRISLVTRYTSENPDAFLSSALSAVQSNSKDSRE